MRDYYGKWAIVEDPDSSWKLSEQYIEEEVGKYNVVERFRTEERAKEEMEENSNYRNKKEHLKVVNLKEERY